MINSINLNVDQIAHMTCSRWDLENNKPFKTKGLTFFGHIIIPQKFKFSSFYTETYNSVEEIYEKYYNKKYYDLSENKKIILKRPCIFIYTTSGKTIIVYFNDVNELDDFETSLITYIDTKSGYTRILNLHEYFNDKFLHIELIN